MADNKDIKRCAIYTRKSSEEGLEQEFNSLDAQREACASYIASQKHEGWELIEAAYDDGGFSGGTMERPGLKQLLADIEAGLVDIVVVYKVDRLSRALSDFAKMVEVFDEREVSFVSVTQQFNTTTSMGRLTLNVLLSFAQFEREVTGERIRDKFAASKKKGIWMGGNVPLGYDCIDRKLIVIEPEADLVRHIYRRYLELKNVRMLKKDLDQESYLSKLRTSAKGNISGGKKFTRGALYAILQNKHYLGLICHKDEAYPGEHDRIIEDELWASVQNLLTQNGVNQKHKTHAKEPSLLSGLLFDEYGNRFSPSHAVKNKKRYRYYVNQAFLKDKNSPIDAIKRIPAHEIEKCVIEQVLGIAKDRDKLGPILEEELRALDRTTMKDTQEDLDIRWQELEPERQRKLIQNAISKVTLKTDIIFIEIAKQGLALLYNALSTTQIIQDFKDQTHTEEIEATLKQCRWESRLVIESKDTSKRKPEYNNALIRAVAQAHNWRQRLLFEEGLTVRMIAEEYGVNERYTGRRLKLAYLSPEIVDKILMGLQPPELSLDQIEKGVDLDWQKQSGNFRIQ
jgi:site-specific DNA recombinase